MHGVFMAFTQTDLNNIDAALVALATGERVEQVSVGGKNLKKSQITEDGLIKLREYVARAVSAPVRRVYAGQVKTR